jgi:hypothetical protein
MDKQRHQTHWRRNGGIRDFATQARTLKPPGRGCRSIKKSAFGCVPRVSPVQPALRNCTRNEGGPFGFGNTRPCWPICIGPTVCTLRLRDDYACAISGIATRCGRARCPDGRRHDFKGNAPCCGRARHRSHGVSGQRLTCINVRDPQLASLGRLAEVVRASAAVIGN